MFDYKITDELNKIDDLITKNFDYQDQGDLLCHYDLSDHFVSFVEWPRSTWFLLCWPLYWSMK